MLYKILIIRVLRGRHREITLLNLLIHIVIDRVEVIILDLQINLHLLLFLILNRHSVLRDHLYSFSFLQSP